MINTYFHGLHIYFEHVYFQFLCLGQCQRPSSGCSNSIDIYKSVDCDGDGILDHACSTTVNSHRWLVLSSEGCPSNWGSASRPVSKCPQAFGGTYYQKSIRIGSSSFVSLELGVPNNKMYITYTGRIDSNFSHISKS